MIPIIAVTTMTALILLLLVFQKRRRTHHKDLEPIEPETPPPGQALPAGQLIPIIDPDPRPPRDPLSDPDRHQAGRAVDPPRNPKAEAAVERLKDLLDAKYQIRAKTRGEAADETAEPVTDRGTNTAQKETTDQTPVRDEKGLFVQGNPGGPGRPRGSKNMLPRGSRKMMKELIAGRITRDGQWTSLKPA